MLKHFIYIIEGAKVLKDLSALYNVNLHRLTCKCPFYKKWNKKKSTIFFFLIITWYLGGTDGYIIVNILSQGAVSFFKCP